MKIVEQALLGGALLVIALAVFGFFGGPSPSLVAPAPLPLAFLVFSIGPIALGLPMVVYWGWGFHLFFGASAYPLRTLVLLVATVIGSIAWYAFGRVDYYYGPAILLVGGAFLIVSVGAAIWCSLRPSYFANVTAHWVLFAWITSYAFPWIGEVP